MIYILLLIIIFTLEIIQIKYVGAKMKSVYSIQDSI